MGSTTLILTHMERQLATHHHLGHNQGRQKHKRPASMPLPPIQNCTRKDLRRKRSEAKCELKRSFDGLSVLLPSLMLVQILVSVHSLTYAHIDGSGSQSPGIDPSRDVQVSTQHNCQHAAHPPFPPQPRCRSSSSSFRNAAVHTAPPFSPD